MKKILLILTALTAFYVSSCSTNDDTKMYDISVTISPLEAGSISPSADSVYEEGQSITLQASPIDSYNFSSWAGDIDSTVNPLTITVDKNYSLTANFDKKSYQLSINTTGEGTVSEEVVKEKDYEHGTVVELTANPSEGWKFREWQGDLSSTVNPDQITIDQPKAVTAVFEEKRKSLEGIISQDSTLTTSKGPYEITAKLQIAYGASLTIEPGVRIYGNFNSFTSENLIEVFGKLIVAGSSENKVLLKDVGINGVFTNNNEPYSVDINHADIIGGGLLFEANGSFIVRDSFLYKLNAIATRSPGKESFIERNVIYNSSEISARNLNDNIFIRNNLFFNDAPNNAEIGYAVENYYSGSDSETIVKGNTFANTTHVAVSLRSGYSRASLNAKENYWSTTSINKIEEMIYDKKDDLNVSEEIPFEPYLESKSDMTPVLPDSLK